VLPVAVGDVLPVAVADVLPVAVGDVLPVAVGDVLPVAVAIEFPVPRVATVADAESASLPVTAAGPLSLATAVDGSTEAIDRLVDLAAAVKVAYEALSVEI
jgi:hypothetical protein